MMDTKSIKALYSKKGIDIQKFVAFLKKEGIPQDIASETIAELYIHLKKGGKDHLNKENYPEQMHHMFEKKQLTEDFWISRYALGICKEKTNEAISKRMVQSANVKTEVMGDNVEYYLKMLTIWTVASGSIISIFAIYCVSIYMGWINV